MKDKMDLTLLPFLYPVILMGLITFTASEIMDSSDPLSNKELDLMCNLCGFEEMTDKKVGMNRLSKKEGIHYDIECDNDLITNVFVYKKERNKWGEVEYKEKPSIFCYSPSDKEVKTRYLGYEE